MAADTRRVRASSTLGGQHGGPRLHVPRVAREREVVAVGKQRIEGAERVFSRLVIARDGSLVTALRRGDPTAAEDLVRKLLGPVYRRFTEGFEPADLIAAKALLDSVR